MSINKINLCSSGEPSNPKTWSGTPYNLFREFKKRGKLASAFDSTFTTNKYLVILVGFISKVYYCNSKNIRRGKFFRNLNACKVYRLTKLSSTKIILHTGTLDLPLRNRVNNQKHYLYCDSTWNLWSTQSTDMMGCTKQLIKDAEKLDAQSYRQMEHIFSISEYVKNDLINHYGIDSEKITVVGTGLGVIQPFYGKKNYNNGKILFAAKGRFADKGGPLVLKAFELALKENPNLELHIVGQNEYSESINLPNVKTYGFIPIEDLQNLFNESSLFLMPAVNEPWGLVYLEALACKTPIIGLNRNSFPELSRYGEYGFGLDDQDPVKLSRTIIELFTDIAKLEYMGKAGQEFFINNFSWEKTVDRIIKIIENKPVGHL